ncbi:TPA: glycosyltransferase family 4 protein [Citrobacter sedlakii]
MKIVIGCSSTIDQGSGILSYCKNLILSMQASGYDILFVGVKSKNNDWLVKNNINFYESDIYGSPEVEVRNLYKKLVSFEPQIIINNDNCFLQQLAPAIDAYFIFVLHLANFAIGKLAKINEEFVDRYIAISTDMKFDLVNKLGIPSNKVKVIFNGLYESHIRDKPLDKYTRDFNSKIVICAGENSYRKGGDLFLNLLKRFQRNNHGYTFIWTAKKEPSLTKNLSNNKFINIVDKLPKEQFEKLLYTANFIVLPSREEGCPMVLLEAMKGGVIPIVSNGKGAMREIIKHGVNGFVCDLDRWSEEVYSILTSPLESSALEYLSGNAKRTFLQSFNNNEFAHELIAGNNYSSGKNITRRISIYRWHRLGRNANFVTSIFNRLCYRFGIVIKIKNIVL